MPGPLGTNPAASVPIVTASKISPSVAPASIAGMTWIRQAGERYATPMAVKINSFTLRGRAPSFQTVS